MKEVFNKKSLSLQNISKKHNRLYSDLQSIKDSPNVEQKLRRQINNKFSKNQRRDQINLSTQFSHRRHSSSLILNNPLTKNSFSLSDAITHKAAYKQTLEPIKAAVKSMNSSRKAISRSYRQNYSSINENFFKTKMEEDENVSKTVIQKEIKSARNSRQEDKDQKQIQPVKMNQRNNKFKLLFRQKNIKYKSASQRKISRIDSKILELKNKKMFLESLIPQQKPKVVAFKPKPKGQIVSKDRIIKMSLSLMKSIELYFNLYNHNNLVGGHLRTIEGYNMKIKKILMLDDNRAKRLTNSSEITNLFWSFKNASQRPEYFGQEDLTLFNTLNYYMVKMQQSNADKFNSFNHQINKKSHQEMHSLKKCHEKFDSKFGKHKQIGKINKFIETRLRFQQDRRQQYMHGLQREGVKLNLIERSRELILRQKERSMKNSLKYMHK